MIMSNYNADFLIQHQNIWSKFFKYSGFLKNSTWFKVIAHGIPTDIFNFSKGMELLKKEIEIFNGIQPIAVNWISSSQNREAKKHESVVISFNSIDQAQKALNKLFIAGKLKKTDIFQERKASEQCLKCQKFGYFANSCINQAICQFCAQNHLTRLHVCKICEVSGTTCIHTNIKCSNCNEKHAANSKECSIVIAALAIKNLNSNSTNSNSIEINS
jgi:hypothetical protein